MTPLAPPSPHSGIDSLFGVFYGVAAGENADITPGDPVSYLYGAQEDLCVT